MLTEDNEKALRADVKGFYDRETGEAWDDIIKDWEEGCEEDALDKARDLVISLEEKAAALERVIVERDQLRARLSEVERERDNLNDALGAADTERERLLSEWEAKLTGTDADTAYVRMADGRIAELEGHVKLLREVIEEMLKPGVFAYEDRSKVSAPEDEMIATLGSRLGYGALMDAASRMWAKVDGIPPGSEHTVGPAASVRKSICEKARAALDATAPEGGSE